MWEVTSTPESLPHLLSTPAKFQYTPDSGFSSAAVARGPKYGRPTVDDHQHWVRLGPWSLWKRGSEWWVDQPHDEVGHGWGVTLESPLGTLRQRTGEDLRAALLDVFLSEVPRPPAERLVAGIVAMQSRTDRGAG
jgi:hypothetical protein